ncbi:hypothetical protein ACH0B5_17810 [Ureibacillus sp. 179-F W5.1 NHS]|uniref:Uncharacterized protein n=1 Tax=Lysinibacillus halotolerans TaxID=1368476 RepID=A0A3M8GYR4_9BACI|nr:hypothetical protein [Lysinibacillus halotolerans]RNC95387.1 hypothetical protein EC501_18130 [Lysinibacillus halotolerans]
MLIVDAAENEGLKQISSVESYVEYLENDDSEEAKETLDEFLSLSEEEQKLYLEALKPENFLKINSEAQKAIDEEIEVELESGQKVDVEFISKQINEVGFNNRLITPMATYKITTPWAVCEMEILGVTVSKYQIRMIYQSNGTSSSSVALQVYDIEKSHKNYNPSIWTTNVGYTNKYVSGGYGYGGYQWTLSSTGSLGFLSANLDLYIKAKPSVKYWKAVSSRDDWASSWRKF